MDRQKLKIFDRDMMKYIALGLMFVGHLISWLNLLRYTDDPMAFLRLPAWKLVLEETAVFCPPVMFFFIADGYRYTRDRKKYALRLLLFAVITQPFDWLLFYEMNGWRSFNVIFTLLLGLLAIMAWESRLKLWQRAGLALLCDAATVLLKSEWMVFGVLFILTLHIFRERPKTRFLLYMILVLASNIIESVPIARAFPALTVFLRTVTGIAAMVAAYLCMTVFYSGKKGKHPVFTKWFFYAFYPLHYLVIWVIFKLTAM